MRTEDGHSPEQPSAAPEAQSCQPARLALWLSLLLILVSSCQTGSDSSGHKLIKIDPGLPEEQIRAEMLKYTPIGMSDTEVMEFASQRLKHEKEKPAYDRPDELTLRLGRYKFSLIEKKDTVISWKFDQNHKLVYIYVDHEDHSF